jgi:hypothetical protein
MGYYIAFALVVPVMIWIPIRLSSGKPSVSEFQYAGELMASSPSKLLDLCWTSIGRMAFWLESSELKQLLHGHS